MTKSRGRLAGKVAIDLTVSMLCAREVLKRSMLERKTGSIVNVSSTESWTAIPRKTHYTANCQ